MRSIAVVLVVLSATSAGAQVSPPVRPVTDPRALVSPANAEAKPVPIGGLGYLRGLLSAAWSADGKTLYFNQDRGGDEQYGIYAVPAEVIFYQAEGHGFAKTREPDRRAATHGRLV